MPKDYDVEEAFRAIENELINSMMRNLSHHRAEEMKEGLNWTSWQAEQLKALNVYKQKNQKNFTKIFADINRNIEKSILLHRRTGETEQEKAILEAIKKGAKLTHKAGSTIEGAFFRINDRKLDTLLSEINAGMRRAEAAMLRMANDQYRKVIFNSQVYYNSGAGTYEKAVDMATKDFLSRGINCIQYKNGARVNIASYAGMALRTANTRAYCQGEGAKRQEWGITTVIVNKRGLPCPKCGRWTGKILIDDVWSGGKASDGPYPLMSQAMAGGLYHPNCKDGHTTYFPGISAKPEKVTKKEMKRAVIAEKQESRDNLIQRNIDKFNRLSTYSLDEENKKRYAARANEWNKIKEQYSNNIQFKNENVYYDKNNDYSIRLEKYSDKVNEGLSKAAEILSKKGSEDGFEHMYLVNLVTGELEYYETNEMAHEVGYKFWKYIQEHKGKKYAFVHNHNVKSSFSEADLKTLLTEEQIPVMVAVRNDSVKYIAERKVLVKNSDFDELYKKDIKKINDEYGKGNITAAQRSSAREMIIINNLIRDYTKEGRLLRVDGRK